LSNNNGSRVFPTKLSRKGIELEFLPPYSPELQPAERLWCLVDEPLINEHFSTLSEL